MNLADLAVWSILTREVREAIALLPERQRRIVELHYDGAVPLQAIGKALAARLSALRSCTWRRSRRFAAGSERSRDERTGRT